jgi:hypothetical protein
VRRLERILDLIRQCEYSVHDLSRVEIDRAAPQTPRFNMPFELGLSVALEKSGKDEKRGWFVCESRNYRLAKSLSDLNGTDPFIHNGTIEGVFRELANMFRRPGKQPTVQEMRLVYRKLGKICRQFCTRREQDAIQRARIQGFMRNCHRCGGGVGAMNERAGRG